MLDAPSFQCTKGLVGPNSVWKVYGLSFSSQSQSYGTIDSQSASLSWFQAPILAPNQILLPSDIFGFVDVSF